MYHPPSFTDFNGFNLCVYIYINKYIIYILLQNNIKYFKIYNYKTKSTPYIYIYYTDYIYISINFIFFLVSLRCKTHILWEKKISLGTIIGWLLLLPYLLFFLSTKNKINRKALFLEKNYRQCPYCSILILVHHNLICKFFNTPSLERISVISNYRNTLKGDFILISLYFPLVELTILMSIHSFFA